MNLSKNDIKWIRSLHLRKFRQNSEKFTVEGDKIVSELLRQNRYRVDRVYALPEWAKRHADGPLPVTVINERELEQISQLTTPNQVLAVVDLPKPQSSPADLTQRLSLYLDGIQSPSNLGAILRIADWFGIRQVFGGPGTADLYNTKTLQASMGAFLRIDYREAELPALLKDNPALNVYGADTDGENVFTVDVPPTGLLLIGNEGQGIRAENRARVQRWLSIPRGPHGGAESLNAAVATGIMVAALVAGRTARF